MTFVDQKGEKYKVIYISRSSGLSGSGKRFAMDHCLCVGNIMLMLIHLVNLKKFKVFIVRENGVPDTDGGAGISGKADINGALGLQQLKAQ
ncbi:hypothetical protein MKX03_033104, partial [Papaver bracteatum]